MAYKLMGLGEYYKNSIVATFKDDVKQSTLTATISKDNGYIVGKFDDDELNSNFELKITVNDLDEYVNHEKIAREINYKIINIYLDALNNNEFRKGTYVISYNKGLIEIKELSDVLSNK